MGKRRKHTFIIILQLFLILLTRFLLLKHELKMTTMYKRASDLFISIFQDTFVLYQHPFFDQTNRSSAFN